eukprot:jgi/Tetstr1/459386/TSEL_004765.t1
MCIEPEDMIGDTMHACIQICPHVAWHTGQNRCKDNQTMRIMLPSREVKVQSRKSKAITKADLPALRGHEVQKMMESPHREIKEGFRKGSNHQVRQGDAMQDWPSHEA